MENSIKDTLLLRILAASSLAVAMPVYAQTAAEAPAATDSSGDALSLEEIVVTASGGDKTKLRSSMSVTDVASELVEALAPRSQAEALRLIPGMIIADTGGPGGNNNFSVRGLPVTTGGAPFVQLQEDGLPTVLFGDIQFGNNDYWQRFDVSNTIEAVRGGNASTLASGAPGAVVNYVSDTGLKQGGQVTLSEGIGFNESKATFALGGPINDSWRYHADGFFVQGRGLRDQGFIAEKGYQIKANVTKEFADDKGYVRFYLKVLNDQEPNTTGAPVLVSASGNQLTSIHVYPGFDSRSQGATGVYNQVFNIVNNSTGTVSQVPASGIHPIANAIGTEFHFNPNGGLAVDDKFRYTTMRGTFSTTFLGLTTASSYIGQSFNGQTVGSVVLANGPDKGQAYTGLANNNAQIYTNMSDMGSTVNDFALSDKWGAGRGNLSARAGLFYMQQNIAQDWHPNQQLQTLSGNNPINLDLISTAGQLLSNNGVSGYNTNWGAGVDRNVDMQVADSAPYIDLTWDLDALQLEGSARKDFLHVTGWAESASAASTQIGYLNGGVFSTTGSLTTPLVAYSTLDASTLEPLNYGFSYTSWSLGGLFQFNRDSSVFARASRGGKANTDRNTLSGYTNPDGSLTASGAQKTTDIVFQQEVGYKTRGSIGAGNFGLAATVFHNSFGVSNFDLTAGPAGTYYVNTYSAKGLEFEGNLGLGGFSLVAQLTYTDAKVDSNKQGPDPAHLVDLGSGYLPGGTPKLTYLLAPTYKWLALSGGIVLQAQSKENIGGSNPYYSPAQRFVDAFVSYDLSDNMSLGLHVNNLFNTIGIAGSGSSQGIVTVNGQQLVSASAEFGRATTLDFTVRF